MTDTRLALLVYRKAERGAGSGYMAGLITEYINATRGQLELYETLVDASNGKKQAVISNNLDEIKAVTSKEQAIVGKIQRMEKERASIVRDIANVLNKKESEITLVMLAGTVKEQSEAGELRELAQKLDSTLEELRAVNDANSALISNALDYIDFSINVIRSTYGDASAMYSPGGASNDKGGFIDKKN